MTPERRTELEKKLENERKHLAFLTARRDSYDHQAREQTEVVFQIRRQLKD